MLTKIVSLINRTLLFSAIALFTLVGLPEVITRQGIKKSIHNVVRSRKR